MKESYELKDLMHQAFINTIYIAIGVVFGIALHKVFEKPNKPVEPINVIETEHKIDSLNQVIETLEAIKNGRIEEIKNLNDSATLSLFNELISK